MTVAEQAAEDTALIRAIAKSLLVEAWKREESAVNAMWDQLAREIYEPRPAVNDSGEVGMQRVFSAKLNWIEGPGIEALRAAAGDERVFRVVLPKSTSSHVSEPSEVIPAEVGCGSLNCQVEITSEPIYFSNETEEGYTFKGRLRTL